MEQITFSIILPLFKQESQVKEIVTSYTYALDSMGERYEILLVINGKSDSTYNTAARIAETHKTVKVFALEQSGWGRAVKYGISQSSGKYICYTNSARTNVNDLVAMLKFSLANHNAVIKATRIVRDSLIRKLGSVIYNFENRLLFQTPVWDVNGTPKIFPSELVKSLPVISDNDLIDAELMTRCFQKKIPIIEIPVYAGKRINGKSTTNILSAFKMYKGLIKLRYKL